MFAVGAGLGEYPAPSASMSRGMPKSEATMLVLGIITGILLYIIGDWMDKRERRAREERRKRGEWW